MNDLAPRFTHIIGGLLVAIAHFAHRHRARAPFFGLLTGRLLRLNTRLAGLLARWRAGTLPRPRAPRPGRPSVRRERPRYPTRHAWLVVEVGHTAAVYGLYIEQVLAEPAFAEFIAAAPQAGRLLRPLCRMLGVVAPPCLRPPAARPAVRPPVQPPSPAPPPPPPPSRATPRQTRRVTRHSLRDPPPPMANSPPWPNAAASPNR